MAFLEISGLRKRFGGLEIVKGIDLTLDKGGFLVLVGPSGCGKSTLLNTIAGLESISSGDVRIDGHTINDLHPSKRDIAMVFQSYALYPNMSVAQNIAFGMEMRGVPKPQRDKAVADVAKTLKIEHLLSRRPSQLSVTPGWPFAYEEMEPWYCRAEALYQVRGAVGDDPTEPKHSEPYPHPPVPDEPGIAAVRNRLKRVGLNPFSLPLGIDIEAWLKRAPTPWDAFPDTRSG